jgi:hypothetical protein
MPLDGSEPLELVDHGHHRRPVDPLALGQPPLGERPLRREDGGGADRLGAQAEGRERGRRIGAMRLVGAAEQRSEAIGERRRVHTLC